MKNQAILMVLCVTILTSCQVKATNTVMTETENSVITPTISPTPSLSVIPKQKEKFDIHSKIGIVDVNGDGITCLRTKNGNLPEKTPVSIIILPYDSSVQVFTATVNKKLNASCARRYSEDGDKNPGENFFYLLSLNEALPEYFGFEIGFGVIEPAQPIKIQNKLAGNDLNEDGKTEFFRFCQGFEGFNFSIWTGAPLKGKRIWQSFYYVNYDTVETCKKKDYKNTED
jgi:hypothetical protein